MSNTKATKIKSHCGVNFLYGWIKVFHGEDSFTPIVHAEILHHCNETNEDRVTSCYDKQRLSNSCCVQDAA